jgi:molybdopterin synthase catalytic subunit
MLRVPSPDADDWVAVTEAPLPIDAAMAWAVRPDCGAFVVFGGTVRDHAEGRSGVTHLEYEAYAEHAESRLTAIVAETRSRWPEVGRVAVLHRVGRLALTEASVAIVVSAPHRAEAFAAARFAIEAVKASAPIWKRESHDGGVSWATGEHELVDPSQVP